MSATTRWARSQESAHDNVHEFLWHDDDLLDCLAVNERLQLSILPSSPALAGAEIELVDESGREYRLKNALESIKGKYDYVLVAVSKSVCEAVAGTLITSRSLPFT